jgi:hypothetical protein
MAMAKVTNLESKTKIETTKAVDAISKIAEVVFAFRSGDDVKPTLGECTRVAGRAAALLKLGDEKEAVENQAAISLARKYGLVS